MDLIMLDRFKITSLEQEKVFSIIKMDIRYQKDNGIMINLKAASYIVQMMDLLLFTKENFRTIVSMDKDVDIMLTEALMMVIQREIRNKEKEQQTTKMNLCILENGRMTFNHKEHTIIIKRI